jgi:hypothetical protein
MGFPGNEMWLSGGRRIWGEGAKEDW